MTLGTLEIRNRLWMAPMCQYSAANLGTEVGRPTSWHEVHYGSRAQGGVGAVIVEATGVVPEGRISINCLSLHSDEQIPSFSRLADLIHAGGAAAFIQLNHSGRKGSSLPMWEQGWPAPEQGSWETSAPSPLAFAPGWPEPRELSEAEILELVNSFAQAARRAIEAGFDGVQIHAAHGYLIHQFLSPISNERTDRWGGDFEGRTRFVREVTRAIRQTIGDVPLLIRVSATDWTSENPADGRQGWTLEETERLAPLVVADGVDMMNVSSGGNVADAKVPGGPGYQVFAARAIRALDTGVPVSTCGLISSPGQAEQIMVDGSADVVEIARPLLSDAMVALVWAGQLRSPQPWPKQYLRGTPR